MKTGVRGRMFYPKFQFPLGFFYRCPMEVHRLPRLQVPRASGRCAQIQRFLVPRAARCRRALKRLVASPQRSDCREGAEEFLLRARSLRPKVCLCCPRVLPPENKPFKGFRPPARQLPALQRMRKRWNILQWLRRGYTLAHTNQHIEAGHDSHTNRQLTRGLRFSIRRCACPRPQSLMFRTIQVGMEAPGNRDQDHQSTRPSEGRDHRRLVHDMNRPTSMAPPGQALLLQPTAALPVDHFPQHRFLLPTGGGCSRQRALVTT